MTPRDLARAWLVTLGLLVPVSAPAQIEAEPPAPALPQTLRVDVPDGWKQLLPESGAESEQGLRFEFEKDGYYLQGSHLLKLFNGEASAEIEPKDGAIDYQVGTIGNSPIFVTFVAPETPDPEGLYRELDGSSYWDPLLRELSGLGILAAKCPCDTVCVLTHPDGSCAKRICPRCPGSP